MKKKFLAIPALCAAFAVALAGCQAALVSSEVSMQKNGSGSKTITAVIYGDDAILAGKTPTGADGETVGNNSKYLLVYGAELEAKVKSYSALDSIEVSATQSNGDTILTITYSFADIAEYNTKTKTLAKDNAEQIEDATFTANSDGSYTYKENCDNTYYSVDNIFESLWNDSTAFDKTGNGDCDLEQWGYTYTSIYTIMSVSATVGDKTEKVEVNSYNSENTVVELDYPDYLEVTGTFSDDAEEQPPKDETPAPEGSNTGLIVGLSVGGAVIVIGAIAATVILIRKKK